jgi:hypothetical protein
MARLYTSFWIYPYLTPLSEIQLLATLNGDDVGRMSEWVDRVWFVWDADVVVNLLSEVTTSFWIYPCLAPLSKIQLLASLNGDDVGLMSEWVDRMWFVWDAAVCVEGGKPTFWSHKLLGWIMSCFSKAAKNPVSKKTVRRCRQSRAQLC